MRGFTHEPGAGGTPEWYTPPSIFGALGLRFVPGDPQFRRRSRSGAPSCLLAFGDECAAALAQSTLGICMVARQVDRQLKAAA